MSRDRQVISRKAAATHGRKVKKQHTFWSKIAAKRGDTKTAVSLRRLGLIAFKGISGRARRARKADKIYRKAKGNQGK